MGSVQLQNLSVVPGQYKPTLGHAQDPIFGSRLLRCALCGHRMQIEQAFALRAGYFLLHRQKPALICYGYLRVTVIW